VTDRPIDGPADRPIDGLLVIDKPAGPTSHDVVSRARRALREKRIGHTGTLDPLATGVLALVIGKATRLAPFLSASDKEYEATVRLGAATDTYDALGRPASSGSTPVAEIDAAHIQRALARFHGTFEQVPPPFSAKKIAGVPAYKLARKQKDVALAAVPVTVHSIELLELASGAARLRMLTSAGFYVRSLAHDLGAALGCGGHLEGLRRTRAGRFGLDRAVPLEALEQNPEMAIAQIVPVADVLPELPSIRLTDAGAARAAHGNFLTPQDFANTGPVPVFAPDAANRGTGPVRVRVMNAEGRLLAIATAGPDGILRPSVVLV
jgi:tRNA pseudouridine55 synthase